jgi:PPOX class probable F420-dependent enzyme
MTEIPAKYQDLLKEKNPLAVLSTVQPDGTPQATPVWLDFHNGHVRFNTARGRVKDRNLAKNSNVALVIVDQANPYRYVQIRGRIASVSEDGAKEIIDTLSHKYLGKPYPFAQPGEVRVTYEVEPVSVQGMG